MARTLLLALLLIVMPVAANGDGRVLAFKHGDDVFEQCPDQDGLCASYVIGLADALEMVAPRLTNICRPGAVTPDQLVDVLIAWLRDNPAQRHRPAAALAGLAFAEAWPCAK